jgi:hypothetical protein
MTAQEFKQEILDHYLDQDLQVTVDRGPSKWTTGNGLLHCGIFYTLLSLSNILDRDDCDRFNKAVFQCWVKSGNITVFGLLNRDAGRPDHEAHDDYIGVCAASFFTHSNVSALINSYGAGNHYSYDNTNPYKFDFGSWHARFPGLIGFYRLSCSLPPGWAQTLMLLAHFKFGASDNAKDNILDWLMAQVIKRSSSRFNGAIESWEKSLGEQFHSLGDIFAPYFGSAHPFSKIKSLSGVL